MKYPWPIPNHTHHIKQNVMARMMHLDPWMLGLLCILMFYGLTVLYSAAGEEVRLLKKQGVHIALGTIAMVLAAQVSPLRWKRFAPILYGLTLALLLGVLFAGASSKGAQRWLDFGVVRFQPSEMMKIALPLMLASYIDNKVLPLRPKALAISVLTIGAPVILVALQPDLGTSLLIFFCGAVVLFFAGLSLRLILGFIGLGVIAMPFVWMTMLDYQKQRVLTFLNPEQDPLGSGYHIIQSKIALGSGGLFGKGWLEGTQTQLDFLPEQNTDFIFSVLGEEFGLVGILILLVIYGLLLSRGFYIGLRAPNTFSRLLAGSLTMVLFVYIFVNIGMVSGLMPVVGVPLPLISYGGTSMMTLMILFGILMSIHTHRPLLPK